MAIRKRKWTTTTGETRENWIFDYRDQHGDRHIKTFTRRKDAEDYCATVKVDVRKGVHTPPSKSVTIAQAAADWLKFSEGEGLERATLAFYRTHVAHIVARIGNQKLASLTKPGVHRFRDELVAVLSRSLASKVMTSFKAIIKDAERRGNVAQNVATGVNVKQSTRDKSKLVIGVDIPTVDETRRIIAAARGRYRPLLLAAIFTGLRSSELRGLRWEDVDFKKGELHVRQRADRYQQIGPVKSKDSRRTLPIQPLLVNTLREWKLKCSPSKGGLAFCTSSGRVARHGDLVRKVFIPTVKRAGLLDTEGKAKYTGLHALRHFYASRCINRRIDGGLELPPKMVQERMGHSSIVMTMDIYGHLFPRGDDDGAEAKAEAALFDTRTHSASR
jgi:integrase